MKVVILAGGYGTRISEESQLKPKPMIEIGDMPILWHIMKIYSKYNINDFVICCGYKVNIKEKKFSLNLNEYWPYLKKLAFLPHKLPLCVCK